MNELLEKIRIRVEPILEHLDAFLIDLTISKVKNVNKLTFFIDKDSYVTVDDCSLVSRELERILVKENFISPSDQIEVSSPGVDRPLKYLRQYPKHKGKYFSVTFRHNDQTLTKELILKDIIDEKLIFEDRGKLLEINYSEIVKAKTLIKFK